MSVTALIDSGESDIDISVEYTMPSSVLYYGMLMFRRQDTTHYWNAYLGRDNAAPYIELTLVNGTSTSKGKVNVTHTLNQVNKLRVVAKGNSIKVYFDQYGTDPIIDITDSTFNDKTIVGLAGYKNENYLYCPADNFIVKPS